MDTIALAVDSAAPWGHNRQMSVNGNESFESAIGDAICEFVQKIQAYRDAKKQAEIDRVVKALLDTIA
jgi:hypothetical protein